MSPNDLGGTLSVVTDKKRQIENVIASRRNWTPIAVYVQAASEAEAHLLELAVARRWQWVNLSSFAGRIPHHVTLRGALLSALPTHRLARQLRQQGIPAVRMGQAPHPNDDKMPAVIPDRSAYGRLAAEHFTQRGFRELAFVGRIPWGMHQSTYQAFVARAEQLGGRCHLLRIDSDQVEATGDQWQAKQALFLQWLHSLPMPVGLLAIGDPLADQYCRWAIEAGFRVPEDLAVLGIGNATFLCESALVPLSSIALDHRLTVETAVDMLDRLIAGQRLEKTTIMIPPRGVVARRSTDSIAASDPRVIAALRFMWEHVTEDLSVDGIAEHLGMSRRTLEKAFRRDLGRGINQEFQRRRLEKAHELLLQTPLSVDEIAAGLSFSSSRQLCRVFAAAYGQSPGKYRQHARKHP